MRLAHERKDKEVKKKRTIRISTKNPNHGLNVIREEDEEALMDDYDNFNDDD